MDEQRTRAQNLARFPNNNDWLITEQDGRNLILSAYDYVFAGDPTADCDIVNTANFPNSTGFDKGTRWLNTDTKKLWESVDGAIGAAVWRQIPLLGLEQCVEQVVAGDNVTIGGTLSHPIVNAVVPPPTPGSIVVAGTNVGVVEAPAGTFTVSVATFPAANVAAGVLPAGVQLPAAQVTAGILPAGVQLAAGQVTAGTLPAGVQLAAGQVTAGTLPAGVQLAAGQVTAGTLPAGVQLAAGQVMAGALAAGVTLPFGQLTGTSLTIPTGTASLVLSGSGIVSYIPDLTHDGITTRVTINGSNPLFHLQGTGVSGDASYSVSQGGLQHIGLTGVTGSGDIVKGGIVITAGSGSTRASLGLATTDSPEFAGINLGHPTDTTLTRVSAGVVAVEGDTVMRQGANSATAAQQVARISTTQFVSPASQGYHLTAAKGFVYVTYSGGTPIQSKSYNVSSLTDNGVGDTTVNWTTAFTSSLLYGCVATVLNTGNQEALIVEILGSRTASASRFQVFSTGLVMKDGPFTVVAFGDQP